MATGRDYLKLLPSKVQDRVTLNMLDQYSQKFTDMILGDTYDDFSSFMCLAFIWGKTPEKATYWEAISNLPLEIKQSAIPKGLRDKYFTTIYHTFMEEESTSEEYAQRTSEKLFERLFGEKYYEETTSEDESNVVGLRTWDQIESTLGMN